MKPDGGFDIGEGFLVAAALANHHPLQAERVGHIAIRVLPDNDFDSPHDALSEVYHGLWRPRLWTCKSDGANTKECPDSGGTGIEAMKKYAVVIERWPDNLSAYVPDLPGCITTGKTVERIEQNIGEAIELQLEGMAEDGEPIAEPRTLALEFEVRARVLTSDFCLVFRGLAFLGKDSLDPLFKRGKIALDHLTENFQVHAKVLVHNHVSGPAAKAQTSEGCFVRKSADNARQASPRIIK